MTRSEQIDQRLQECRDVAALRNVLGDLCCAFGSIVGITILCSRENLSKGMCVIDFPPDADAASRCAAAIGGRVFGYNSVILSFTRHPEFSCERGFPPPGPSCACNH